MRQIFRRVRMAGWVVVFTIIFGLLYFNLVGLPGFIKKPLQEKLRARGVELEFKNLRLSWYRGLIAYDVSFGGTNDATAPQLTARRVQMGLIGSRLWHLDFQIGSLLLRDGRFVWPLEGTNRPALEKINGDLRFLPGDEWQLENLEAQLRDIKVRVTGSITNASALRDWQAAKRRTPSETSPEERQARMQRFADKIAALHFENPPVVRIDFSGDALARKPFRLGLRSKLDGGALIAQALLNPATGMLRFAVYSDFDVQEIRPLLTPKTDAWLGRFAWEKPPQLRFLGAVSLPTWTNTSPDWAGQVLPTLKLDGELQVGRVSFRGVPAMAARSRVLYMDQTWRLPNLHIIRPEGEMQVVHWTHDPTRDYYWRLQGDFDLKAVRALLTPAEQRGLDLVEFTTPPHLDLEMWSRWHERERTGVKGRVAVSNVTFRGVSMSSVETGVEYTNLWLHLSEPRVTRGVAETGTLSSLDVDFRKRMVHLTNGVSTLDPAAIAHAIGPKTAEAMQPYQFLTPPHARVEGSVSTTNSRIADMRFELEGGPFHWWKFNAPHIAGNIIWSNNLLSLTNVTGDFYGGSLTGNAGFDFGPALGDEFHFDIHTTNTSLALLMPDLGSRTNKLEGDLNLRLVVAQANTKDFHSWQGYGNLVLQRGQLWEIPVFGIFAPVLDTVYPNLGSGRASDGSASFTITNSVIYTDNLELRSPSMRMQYRGSVDFDGNLNARAESELLRNTVLIGPLISTVFSPVSKLLEYQVTGSLKKPVAEPVHIPKMFLMPLHPFQTLKSIFTEEEKDKAPPEFKELSPSNPSSDK